MTIDSKELIRKLPAMIQGRKKFAKIADGGNYHVGTVNGWCLTYAEVVQAIEDFCEYKKKGTYRFSAPVNGDWDVLNAYYYEPKGESEEQTEYHGTEDMEGLYYCPICQQTTTVVKDGKCPKCGATMDELSTRDQTEDAISRQAVLDGLASIAKAKAKSDAQKSLMGRVMFFTERLPSVNPQPKTGHWKQISPARIYECDICGQNVMTDDISAYRYCHGCGTKMVEPRESEDKCKKCEYHRNPDYTRCHECKAESEE